MTNGIGDHSTTTTTTTTTSTSNSSGSKNINESEMKFIVGLNELYERCYGGSVPKRQYRLPRADMLDISGENDQSEAK